MLDKLADLGIHEITIIGGESAVSASQERALSGAGYTVERVAGADRYRTNEQILEERPTDASTALIATGADFPDALAGGPLSYAEEFPLAITEPDDMPDSTIDAMTDEGIDQAIVLGGTAVVGEAVVDELEREGITVLTRLAGATRSETSAAVARYGVEELGLSVKAVNIASGDPALDGADALSAGPVSGAANRALLITTSSEEPGEGVQSFLLEHANTLTDGKLFGGPASVGSSARQEMFRVAQAAYTLTLLHANDLESELLGIDAPAASAEGAEDYDTDKDADGRPDYGGVDRHATLADQLRADASEGAQRDAILVSAGDTFLAGPQLAASKQEGAPLYDALGMKLTDYDASTVGNHEFDFGPEFFARFVQEVGGAFPFLTANLDFSEAPELKASVDSGDIVEHTVVDGEDGRIGLIGLTTPELPAVSSPGAVTVDPDLVASAKAEVTKLREMDINKIIVVSHLQDIDNERALAAELDHVDVIVGGGGGELMADEDHPLIPGDERSIDPETGEPYTYPIVVEDADGTQVPIVTTPGKYSYVGKLVIGFDGEGNVIPGSWEADSLPVRVAGVGPDAVAPDQEVNEQVVQPVAQYVESLQQQVVAQTEVDLVAVRDQVRTRMTNFGALITDAVLWSAQKRAAEFDVPVPEVGIQNGGGIRSDSTYPAGALSQFDTFSVLPFGNFVAVVEDVDCTTFKALLERGVSGVPQPAGQFIQVAGVHTTYDPAQPAQEVDPSTGEILTEGSRVVSATIVDESGAATREVIKDGEVVSGCEPITIATNDFSASGGDNYPLGEFTATNLGLTNQQALVNFLTEELGGTVTAEQYSKEAVQGRITAQ